MSVPAADDKSGHPAAYGAGGAQTLRALVVHRPAAGDRRRTPPDHRQAGGPGCLCLRRHVLDGLCHPGNPGYPGGGRRRRLLLAFPISIAIVILLVIVTISYEQTIHAYPGGGGSYIVARDNLGELPAQTAGAALLTDYVLTVAVSVSSGVAQIVSAFPRSSPTVSDISVALGPLRHGSSICAA